MLKVQRIGQLVSPAEVSEHTESSPSQVVNDLHVRAVPKEEVQGPCSDGADEKEAGIQSGPLIIKGGYI